MNTRLKELRKNILKLTLKEFGKEISLSAGGLGDIESGRTPLQERHIKLISQAFNVNEDWLRNGTEPIFIEKENDIQILLQKEYGLSELASSIIKSYIELPEEEQKIFEKFVFKVFKEMQEKNSKDEKEFEEDTKSFEDIVGNPDEILKNKKEKEEVS